MIPINSWKEFVRSMQSKQLALTTPFCIWISCSPFCYLTTNMPVLITML